MDMGFDGLLVEAHCSPDEAWSDKNQQVAPETLIYILNQLIIRDMNTETDNLTELRLKIDKRDNELMELLSRRMQVSDEIGRYKMAHNMPILQAQRYEETLERRARQAVELGMDREFMRTVMQAIHEESIRHQANILGAASDK
jgi:chorismate mutase